MCLRLLTDQGLLKIEGSSCHQQFRSSNESMVGRYINDNVDSGGEHIRLETRVAAENSNEKGSPH